MPMQVFSIRPDVEDEVKNENIGSYPAYESHHRRIIIGIHHPASHRFVMCTMIMRSKSTLSTIGM